ncbi:MAG: PHP domain-containing protein [Clostridia bacterium]|nr:PHP domain-containing protein [Clostridia bacterium]
MRCITDRYAVYPSVVRANKRARLTVTATENIFLFFEDREYTVKINPYDSDVLDYHNPSHKTVFTVTAHGGVLSFEYDFCDEGEYCLEISDGETRLQLLKLYALKDDLFERRPLKGDFHGHSYRSDGKHDPAALAGFYRENGYDFMTMTDHNRYFPSDELREAYSGVKLGFTVINGEEVHTPGSIVHIVHAGGVNSVDDIYFKDSARYETEYRQIENELPDSVPAQYRTRFAMAKWACGKIHDAGGLAIFAHPFWRPAGAASYNVKNDFARLLLTSGMFDAYELVGGMGVDGVNMSVAMWNDLRAYGLNISVVGSSDVHTLEGKNFAYHFTVVFAKDNTPEAVIQAVRDGYSVAVEMSGGEDDREYRCYGSMRLVIYTQFLLGGYFKRTAQITAGEGVAMRRYLIGEEDGALLSAMQDRTGAFYRRFFGIDPPVLPDKKRLDYENKWRGVQLNSPETRGSSLYVYGKNQRNI